MSSIPKGLSTTTGLLALAVAFIAAVIVSNVVFRGARLDLTENKLYTLTDGTRNILGNIDEPINLYFFFSDKLSEEQELGIRQYANRVRELVEEFAAAAGDGIRLQVIDPQPFSEEEDQAAEFGLQAVPVGPAAENLYFGLAGTNAIDGLETIPFFQPDPRREAFLEYDLAKLVHTLANPELPVVGVMSSLSMSGGFDPMSRRSTEPWVIYTQLDQLFDLRNVPATATTIDEDVDLLVVVHPKDLSQETVYAIDQFVLGGGRAVFFVDPHADADVPAQDPSNPTAAMFASRASDLATLFGAWGVDVADTEFVGDARYAVTTSAGPGRPPARHLGILSVDAEGINSDDVVTAELGSIITAMAGFIQVEDDAAVTVTPLVQSSPESAPIAADKLRFLSDPGTLRDGFAPDAERYVLAARLTGTVPTAFPDGKPGGDAAADGEALTEGAINVVLVADADMLTDRLWVQVQNFFGRQIFSAFANNGDFVVNTIDNLTGSSDLIAIRGRATFTRPFDRVEELKREADDRFRAVEQRLQEELDQTEARLNDLQTARNDSNTLLMTSEQQAEIDQFLEQKLRIRKELRQVRRDLDKDIEGLGTWLKVINIGLVPLLVLAVALAGVSLRNRRAAAIRGGQA